MHNLLFFGERDMTYDRDTFIFVLIHNWTQMFSDAFLLKGGGGSFYNL